jgi:hypothetical protein
MGTFTIEIEVDRDADSAWDAARDYGALHSRLVPGFVTATELIPGGRRVTFFNGVVIEEPIIALSEEHRRLVWSAKGAATTHYNASLQVFARADQGSRLVWTADYLPDSAGAFISDMMKRGAAAMKQALA